MLFLIFLSIENQLKQQKQPVKDRVQDLPLKTINSLTELVSRKDKSAVIITKY